MKPLKHFEIQSVTTNGVVQYGPTEHERIFKFTDITVRITEEIDWTKDADNLLKRLRTATELNES